jgi:hypothetical protein
MGLCHLNGHADSRPDGGAVMVVEEAGDTTRRKWSCLWRFI